MSPARPSLTLRAELRRRPSLEATAGRTALVPGCGRAYDALALAEHGYAAVVALDLSPAACKAAREELQASASAAAGRVEVRCGDFFALEACETFDLIGLAPACIAKFRANGEHRANGERRARPAQIMMPMHGMRGTATTMARCLRCFDGPKTPPEQPRLKPPKL